MAGDKATCSQDIQRQQQGIPPLRSRLMAPILDEDERPGVLMLSRRKQSATPIAEPWEGREKRKIPPDIEIDLDMAQAAAKGPRIAPGPLSSADRANGEMRSSA